MKQNKYSVNFKFKQYCESVLNVSLFWYIFFGIPLMSKVFQKEVLLTQKIKIKIKKKLNSHEIFSFMVNKVNKNNNIAIWITIKDE